MSLAETVINAFLDRKLAQPAAPALRTHPDDRSLAKGIVAGLIAGLAATAAKTVVERVYPPSARPEANSAGAGRELALVRNEAAAEPTHWAVGAAIGGAYGGLAEFYPAASSRDGVNFGMTVMALTHENVHPASGFPGAPADQSLRSKSSEIASHIVFGLVAETTRRLVRKLL